MGRRPTEGKGERWVCFSERILSVWGPIVGRTAVLVYLCLASHANRERRCWPSLRRMASTLKINKGTLIRAIQCLEHHGLVQVERDDTSKGKRTVSNRYLLIDVPDPSQTDLPFDSDGMGRAGATGMGRAGATGMGRAGATGMGRAGATQTIPIRTTPSEQQQQGDSAEVSPDFAAAGEQEEQKPQTDEPAAPAEDPPHEPTVTALAERGVSRKTAAELAQNADPDLIREALAVHAEKLRCGRVGNPAGMLVTIIRQPEEYGIQQGEDGQWRRPPQRGSRANAPPAAAETPEEREARLNREAAAFKAKYGFCV